MLTDLGLNGRPSAETITIKSSGRAITLREATRYLTSIGLVEQMEDERLAVTELAHGWLTSYDKELLLRILHASVQYFGELLAVLDGVGGTASNAELLDGGKFGYAMNWSSLDPIRRRTSWLRAAGMVQQYDGQVHLTDTGRSFLRTLEIAEPLTNTTAPIFGTLAPTAIPEVATLLEGTTDSTLQRRDKVANYLVAINGSVILAIREFVQELRVRLTETTFIQQVKSRCGVSASSAAMMLATLRKLGLVERVGPDTFQATTLGVAWCEDGDVVDLVRIAHTRLWGMGEILALMDTSPTSGQYLLKAVGLPSAARERLRLLVEAGLARKFDQSRYVITPLGRAVREGLPTLVVAPSPESEGEAIADPENLVRPDAEAVAAELELASVSSDESTRLEKALAAALELLGLAEVTIFGGQGRTDVVGVLPQPWHDGLVICFDAKSSSSGIVAESRVSFAGLAEHRQKHGGNWSVLVGPAFHHRVHVMAQSDGRVSVLDVKHLARVVRLNAHAPLLPEDLRVLFDPARSDDRVRRFKQYGDDADRARNLIRLALMALEDEAHNPLENGWLSPLDIVRACRRQSQLTASEVSNLLTGLSSIHWVGGVEQNNRHQFRLIAPVEHVLARVRFLTMDIDE